MARASSLLTRPSGPVLFGLATDQEGRGWALPGLNQSVYRAELLAVTLALERLRGSGRVVSDCKDVVKVVAAFRAGKRPPRGKHIDLERRILRAGAGNPVSWIKTHRSDAHRRSLGTSDADFLGNERANVAAKEALPPPSPHIANGTMWREHAEKFRLLWGTFGPPTLARRVRQEKIPQQPREKAPPVFGPEAPKEIGAHPRLVVGTDPPLHQMSLVWLLVRSRLEPGVGAFSFLLAGGPTCRLSLASPPFPHHVLQLVHQLLGPGLVPNNLNRTALRARLCWPRNISGQHLSQHGLSQNGYG